jgi:hypothetical protein
MRRRCTAARDLDGDPLPAVAEPLGRDRDAGAAPPGGREHVDFVDGPGSAGAEQMLDQAATSWGWAGSAGTRRAYGRPRRLIRISSPAAARSR